MSGWHLVSRPPWISLQLSADRSLAVGAGCRKNAARAGALGPGSLLLREQVGEDLHACQAAVSPLLTMTGSRSQQAANADCSGCNWKVVLPFQRTGERKWDKWEFKRREASRGEEWGRGNGA